jgi:hypothetical protein
MGERAPPVSARPPRSRQTSNSAVICRSPCAGRVRLLWAEQTQQDRKSEILDIVYAGSAASWDWSTGGPLLRQRSTSVRSQPRPFRAGKAHLPHG